MHVCIETRNLSLDRNEGTVSRIRAGSTIHKDHIHHFGLAEQPEQSLPDLDARAAVPGHTARSAVAHARRHVSWLRRAGGSVLRPAPRRCTWGPCPESSGSRGIPHRTQHTQGAALCRAALAGAGGRSCAGGRRGRPADRRQDQDCIAGKPLEQESRIAFE